MIDWVTNFDSAEQKREFYEMLKGLGGEQLIQIKPKRAVRSCNQNRYYWGVVIRYYREYTGYTPYEAHVRLGDKFLLTVVPVEDDGFWSTTALSTVEFEEYLQAIRDYCESELNLKIPLPNEVIF